MDFGRIWVASTTLLISFIGFSSQIFVILPFYLDRPKLELIKLLLPFNILLFSVFFNYYLCIVTDPGSIPKNWIPESKDYEDETVEVKKLTGGPRYCRTCKAYKPPRAHHCRKCKKCIRRMDHHCPWVNNCVGFANHGHFIRFLFSVDVACSYHLWMISSRAFGAQAFYTEPSTLQVVMLVLNYTAGVPVLIAVGMFSIFHFWSIAANTTTIEGWEKDKVALLKHKGRIREVKYPYHLGIISNIKSILGSNILLWCLPQKMKGDGLKYPVAFGLGKKKRRRCCGIARRKSRESDSDASNSSAQDNWPPRDEFSGSLSQDSSQHRRRRLIEATESPFTYGSGLNPSLQASTSSHDTLRNRRDPASSTSSLSHFRPTRPKREKYSPYHDNFNPSSSSENDSSSNRNQSRHAEVEEQDEVDEDDEDEEDSTPLSTLANRRLQNSLPRISIAELEPPSVVRVRRGSEGYEVRPLINRPLPPSEIIGSDRSEDGEWDRLSDDSAEFDQDGDRMRRRGVDRYKRYEPESLSDSEGSDTGNDSMDEYLDDILPENLR